MIKLVSSSILRFLAGNLLGVVVKFFKKHILLVALTVQKVKPVHVLDKIEQILAQPFLVTLSYFLMKKQFKVNILP